MSWVLRVLKAHDLERYAEVSMTIIVETVLQPVLLGDGLGGLRLKETMVSPPFQKDYDQHGGPTSWPDHFDLTDWQIVVAVDHDRILGGAAAFGEGQSIAELWDIRIREECKRAGIGRALLRHQQDWARQHGYRWLKAETQNVNVGACRFYQRQGGMLGAINCFAYAGQADVEHEIELDWFFSLGSH